MNSEHSIIVENLTKRFGTFTAVSNASFSVCRGSIFGLLGANGAGKSTIIRILCGLLLPTSGTATVADIDVRRNPEAVKRKIGYMSQKFSLYGDLTPEENIRFFGGVYGLSNAHIEMRLAEIIDSANLAGNEKTLTRELSGGWKQRLALGCSIVHRPPILFLDEPTGGTDPIARKQFWEVINQLADSGTTILVTTHFLDEAEYCNEIVLMHAGELIAQGSPSQLKSAAIIGDTYEIDCPEPVEALAALQQNCEGAHCAIFGNHLHVGLASGDNVEPALRMLENAQLGPAKARRITPSLEDVFIRLIDKRSKMPNGHA